MSWLRGRALLIIAVVLAGSCVSQEITLAQQRLAQSGGELELIGDLNGHGAAIVLVDGVAAHSAVLDGQRLSVQVPPLPRAGLVDVELVFADGTHERLLGALTVSAPSLNVSD
ncbi:hypothetical protein DB30_06481 [Enhygromyxa salina]|uniref:Uncharacterized protein n=1 Tax=Enhygromyxa salina TaxID=215803 RepID=A0A0C2CYF3_9BACT|nr:hypothetical protein [Enhygromyxa salina]KIG14670.1 hypothetical protein DB30_06481 [Enhygromyxa salina]